MPLSKLPWAELEMPDGYYLEPRLRGAKSPSNLTSTLALALA